MSGKTKEKITRHYTLLEKETFLQLLVEYKDIIENKKSNSSTLKAKEDAWKKVVERFNSSLHCYTPRNVTQLKKFWSNLKHQREAKTKETQARMGTGGGPEPTTADIDPTVELINPHLMQRAPCAFSSNLTQEDLERNVALVNAGSEVLFVDADNSLIIPMDESDIHDEREVVNEEEETSSRPNLLTRNPLGQTQSSSPSVSDQIPTHSTRGLSTGTQTPSSDSHSSGSSASPFPKRQNVPSSSWKKKKTTLPSSSSSGPSKTEQELKAERIKKIIKQNIAKRIEEEIYRAKLAFELESIEKKRKHQDRMFQIEESTALAEERAAKARADLAELELEKVRKRYLS